MPLSLHPPGSGHSDNTARQTKLLKNLGLPGDISAVQLQVLLEALQAVPENERLPLIERSALLRDTQSSKLEKHSLAVIVERLATSRMAAMVIAEIGQTTR